MSRNEIMGYESDAFTLNRVIKYYGPLTIKMPKRGTFTVAEVMYKDNRLWFRSHPVNPWGMVRTKAMLDRIYAEADRVSEGGEY